LLSKNSSISIVIPIYNEEECLNEAIERLLKLREKLIQINLVVELIFVNDGSDDKTLQIIQLASKSMPYIKVISFSRNFGHQIAISAGIHNSTGSYVAIIDADLQDPPELIFDMYKLAVTGYDVVYGQRRKRAGESLFKKISAKLFYRILSSISETKIPLDTGDFRIISRKVVDAFNEFPERHRYIRGMIAWIGFRSIAYKYDREERFAGVTKFPLVKMLSFALNAVFSFSGKPLKIMTNLGLVILLFGIIGVFYMLYLKLFTSETIPGLTTVLLAIVIFSGTQILLIGLLGEYVVRIFEEKKKRPLYIIDEKINF
jgi:polyisoprenyl-phosphate glycosyltransferase